MSQSRQTYERRRAGSLLTQKGEKYSPSAHCQAILNSRSRELSTRARSFWKCLSLFHSKAGEVAEQVPNMPHTISTPEHSFTFGGSPRPFADVMKAIMLRFPRPFLPLDPFDAAPAETWEAAQQPRHHQYHKKMSTFTQERRMCCVTHGERTLCVTWNILTVKRAPTAVSLLRKNMPRTRQPG